MMFSPPPVPTNGSYSLTSPFVATRSHTTVRSHWQYRDLEGRILGPEDDTFLMPPDEMECDRMDLQHNMLQRVIRSLYYPEGLVDRILAPRDGPAPAILDIGSGNGTWAVAMAQKFPHCEIVGIDLTPTLPKSPVPVNCKFETDDANYPLEHYANAFDVVHCRAIDGGITDYGNFLNECARALRPGGILLLVKGTTIFYDPQFTPIPVLEEGQEGFSAVNKIFHEATQVVKSRGGYEDAELYWKYWIEHNPNYVRGLYNQQDRCVPISAWLPDSELDGEARLLCELCKHNILAGFRSCRALLLEESYDQQEVDHWIDLAEQELHQKTFRAYSRWRFAYAIRTDKPWMGMQRA
ncbi:hypothetical protein FRC03_012029 [Tulasnella sp. 419]|nr:hypothetical protein FRC03_012029 [Tulasnella sp. 419]